MAFEAIAFYLFGAIAVAASLLVIAQRNPIYSVLLLIASFGALSGLYVLLEAPFVEVIQIIRALTVPLVDELAVWAFRANVQGVKYNFNAYPVLSDATTTRR